MKNESQNGRKIESSTPMPQHPGSTVIKNCIQDCFFNKDEVISIEFFFPLSEKTPIKSRAEKRKILELLYFFSREALEALLSFYSYEDLFEFDPHVGDALCQIRAYKILTLTKNIPAWEKTTSELIKSFRAKTLKIIKDFNQLLKEKGSQFDSILDKTETLNHFMQHHHLSLHIPADLFFLTQARILTKLNEIDSTGLSKSINCHAFSISAGISKNAAKKTTRYYQRNLARTSCVFLKKILDELPDMHALKKIFHLLIQTDQDRRAVLPCYEATKIILKHLLTRGLPLLLIVERSCDKKLTPLRLVFFPNIEKNDFALHKQTDLNNNLTSLTIKGVVSHQSDTEESDDAFTTRLLSKGLYQVILANMANHPQYAAPELESLSENPYLPLKGSPNISSEVLELEQDLLKMKKIGEELGCSIKNQSLLLIRHIFCDFI